MFPSFCWFVCFLPFSFFSSLVSYSSLRFLRLFFTRTYFPFGGDTWRAAFEHKNKTNKQKHKSIGYWCYFRLCVVAGVLCIWIRLSTVNGTVSEFRPDESSKFRIVSTHKKRSRNCDPLHLHETNQRIELNSIELHVWGAWQHCFDMLTFNF